MTITKDSLAKMLSEEIGLNGREARSLVKAFFEELAAALVRGEDVKLHGFGHSQLRDKAPRPGRNPNTRDEVPISARRVVTFRASRTLRKRIEKQHRR